MLECGCGWLGVNLVPNYEEKTCRCPACKKIFAGIRPENIVTFTAEQEEALIKESKTFALLGQTLFPD